MSDNYNTMANQLQFFSRKKNNSIIDFSRIPLTNFIGNNLVCLELDLIEFADVFLIWSDVKV